MGIFNSLLKGLGFEDSDEENQNNYNYDDDIIKKEDAKQSKPESVNLNNLVIYSPKSNNDVKKLVDCLKKGEACIINLDSLKTVEQTRILDFLSGAVYAISGKINKLQNNLFVLLPNNVRLTTM